MHYKQLIINTSILKSFFFLIPTLILLYSCASIKKRTAKKVESTLESKFFENQFTGFFMINAQTKDTLFDYNSEKYFTPASNTKIVTLYAALKLLPERIPALKYRIWNDTLYIQGTGDPTWLHPYFKDSIAIQFLKGYAHISLDLNNFDDEKFGPGWSWGDYHYYYQPERGSLPLYGNILTVFNLPEKKVYPGLFRDSVVDLDLNLNREAEKNRFYFSSKRKDTIEIPFRTDSTLTRKLLENVLGKHIKRTSQFPKGKKSILMGISTDSVLKRMMQVSDNFLAEQLLVLISSTLSDTLNSAKARKKVSDSLLQDLEQPPRWVDGSGLSRYNLFTPQSIVDVLFRMYGEVSRERLFNFFPKGGISGTLEDWYPGSPKPYIIAKTGSLGNNHCLSGYLITNSGKTLIFSFMNNHFRHPSSEVKKRMQHIFETIRDKY